MKELLYSIDYDKLINYPISKRTHNLFHIKRGYTKRGVKCMADVYKCLDIDFKNLAETFNNNIMLSVSQIFINPKSWDKIENILKASYKDNYKNRGKGIFPTFLLFDIMNTSPVYDESIEEDIIIIKSLN